VSGSEIQQRAPGISRKRSSQITNVRTALETRGTDNAVNVGARCGPMVDIVSKRRSRLGDRRDIGVHNHANEVTDGLDPLS
jgi:hypothetical protein